MNLIYTYSNTVSIPRQEIIKILEDDAFIIHHFNILDGIEYTTESRREIGTNFNIILHLNRKHYRFKSKIIRYAPSSIGIITYTKYGEVKSRLSLEDKNTATDVSIISEIDNNHLSTKFILKIMQPIVKIALDRSINNLFSKINHHNVSQ